MMNIAHPGGAPLGLQPARGAFARISRFGAILAMALTMPFCAIAFDTKEGQPEPLEKGTAFSSVVDALRAGIQGLRSGNPGTAIEPLTFAARGGNDAAQLRLARMYAEGEGVPKDHYRAYREFSMILERRAAENPDSPKARIVAQAFVALGAYHLSGIPNSPVRRDPARAWEMFHYAATYFGEPDAQYHLGLILSEGSAGDKDLQQAARWFNLAAAKGHAYAQARLGQMLFNGDGVPRQAPLGLMWMQLAVLQADPVRDSWVIELNDKARDVATEDERRLSEAFMRRQRAQNSR